MGKGDVNGYWQEYRAAPHSETKRFHSTIGRFELFQSISLISLSIVDRIDSDLNEVRKTFKKLESSYRSMGHSHSSSSSTGAISFKLDENLYKFASGDLLCCKVKYFRTSCFRNAVWGPGISLEVSILFIAWSGVSCSNSIVFPHTIQRIIADLPELHRHSLPLAFVAFEFNSTLTGIELNSRFCGSSVRSICIPASVEILDDKCFSNCQSLSSLTFESDSHVTRIGKLAFKSCELLLSICIPASVEVLCTESFADCRSLVSVSFESDSRLTRIEEMAFFLLRIAVHLYSGFCLNGSWFTLCARTSSNHSW
jgi:hypothetical protein